MDEDGIGLVLARASELRSKITNCIHRASSASDTQQSMQQQPQQQQEREDKKGNENQSHDKVGEAEEECEEEDEAEESLLNIRDALESLEALLSSLQALQQQQWYEKEAALAEIDFSRKKLLEKLKEYRGEELEVLHEATAFASETVEDNNDLLLPPYPSRPSRSLVLDNAHLSHFPSTCKFAQNGFNETKKSLQKLEVNQVQSGSQKPPNGLRFIINAAAKTVLTLVGVLSILGLAGFEPRLRKRDTEFKVSELFQHRGTEAEREMVQCPPGKVLVVAEGETRCVVKERVEIPFEPVVATPDVNYGCG